MILFHNLPEDTGNVNFGFHYIDTFSDARVFATEVIRAIPGQGVTYTLTLNNHGARSETGTLFFIFDSLFTYNSSSPAATLSGDTLKWNFTNLPIGANVDYNIAMTTHSNAPVGTVFNDTAYVSILNHDSFPANNLAVITDVIVAAYQRNNKTVSPTNYDGGNFQAGDYLTYTITFQNTDTVPVAHAWIIDTLSGIFDMATLNVVAASAPYQLTIDSNALRVDFYNINLPDSAANQDGSHGFFEFRIRPFSMNLYNITIHNIAYIYLDGRCDTVQGLCNMCISTFNIGVWSQPDATYECQFLTTHSGQACVSINANPNVLGPVVYTWSNGNVVQTTDSLYNCQDSLSYGQYYVTVTDGCSTTAIGMPYVDTVVEFYNILSASAIITGADCPNHKGSALAIPCGAFAPYRYHWSNGQTTDTATGLLGGGTYYCTVTDTSGQEKIVSVQIPQDNNFNQVSFVSSNCFNQLCYGSACGGAAILYSWYWYSGPPLSVLWSNGDTGYQVSSLATGSYSVTATDTFGCKVSYGFSIQEIQFNSLYALYSCSSDSTVTYFYDVSGADAMQFDGYDTGVTVYSTNYPQDTEMSGSIVLPSAWCCSYVEADAYNVCLYDTTLENPGTWQPPPPTISAISNPKCLNDSTGTVLINWVGVAGEEEVHNLPPGIYNFTTTGGQYGCVDNASFTLNATDSLVIDTGLTVLPSCPDSDNGSIALIVGQGSGYYKYNWNNGEESSVDSSLTPGNYVCTVTDSTSGCTVSQRFNLPFIDSLRVQDSIISPSCYGRNNGSVHLFIQNVQGSYVYNWSNNQHAAKDTMLSAGMYSCTVSDSAGCFARVTYNLTQPDSLYAVADLQNAVCAGEAGSIRLTVTGGTPTYTYSWSNDEYASKDSLLQPGSYACTISDANGCTLMYTDTGSFYADTALTPLIIYESVYNAKCYGLHDGIINLTVAGGAGSYHYDWSNGEQSARDTLVAAGTYSCTISDTNGCTALATGSILQPDSFSIAVSSTGATCFDSANGHISLSVSGASGDYTYSWSNGERAASDTLLIAGAYRCTITDANGCTTLATANILQPDSFSIAANSTNPACFDSANGRINLSVSGGAGGYIYTWSNNVHVSINAMLPAGNYSCTITDVNGCSTTRTVTLTQPAPLFALLNFQAPDCGASTGTLTADSISGGTQPYALHWSNGDTGVSISDISSGLYFLTITDNNGCVYNYSDSVPCITGITNFVSGDLISIFPNPANTMLYIASSQKQDYELLLLDITGQVVQQTRFTQSTVLNVVDLARGVYLAEIYDSNKLQVGMSKVVLQ